MSYKEFSTNQMIQYVTENIDVIQRHEIGLLEFVEKSGPDLGEENKNALRQRVERPRQFLRENIELLKFIREKQANGELRFFDPAPLHLAVLRLNAAIGQAEVACGDVVALPY